MLNFQNKRLSGPVALLVSLVLTTVVALVWGSAATSASAAAAARPVAQAPGGDMTSRIRGETANGRTVTGTFVPTDFNRRNGKVFARGMVQGVIHNANGSERTFAVMRSIKVQSVNGTDATRPGRTAARGAASCRILHLVLGPLDLNLLGLHITLNRVVLHIEAERGPDNLLGNLLCAVANLLNGGLEGALGRLTRLLNRILGQLGLGL